MSSEKFSLFGLVLSPATRINFIRLLIVTVGICGSSVQLRAQSRQEEQQISQTKESYQLAAQNKPGTGGTPFVVKLQDAPKAQIEAEQDGADRQDRLAFEKTTIDLTKSNTTANWLLVCVGMTTIFVYGVQAAYLYFTLKHSRESSEKQLRAYVVFDHEPSERKKPSSNPENFRIWVQNLGQTPAKNLTTEIGWKWFDGADTPWPTGSPYDYDDSMGTKTTLGMGHTAIMDSPLKPYNGVRWIIAHNHCTNGTKTIYCYGTTTYWDVFGVERCSNFCMKFCNGVSSIYDHHNDCD